MKYYVVSDVHGFYNLMKSALQEAGFFDEKEPCKLVVCGDMLDRGEEAILMVDFMLRLLKKDKLIYIRGNHEDLFMQCLQQIVSKGVHEVASGMSHHFTNGTWDTLLQLSCMDEMEAYSNAAELVGRVRRSPYYKELLSTCVDYYETPNYIFTHGWIPCYCDDYRATKGCKYNPNWRTANVNAWKMARWFNGMDMACKHKIIEENKTIVCGHYHASYGHARVDKKGSEFDENADFSPFRAKGILAIDACTAYSGVVNCVVIED